MKKIILSIILLTSCSVNQEQVIFRKSSFSDLKNWESDNHLEALQAFNKSCHKTKLRICEIAQKISTNQEARKFFEENFEIALVKDSQNQEIGLFTGYYEISLNGSKEKTSKYQYPIHALPKKDYLKNLTRKELSTNPENVPLLYVDDKIDLFMLHVQGSGIVNLPNGQKINVGYAGRNNHKYQSIGKYLIEIGALKKEEISAESIKDWLTANSAQIDEILFQNPSYIFFEIKKERATGSAGVVLTAERSLAIDTSILPLGMPFWVETSYPFGHEFHKLMISQDSGQAIKGAVRGDIFFGNGHHARKLASHMKSQGKYYILTPKFSK